MQRMSCLLVMSLLMKLVFSASLGMMSFANAIEMKQSAGHSGGHDHASGNDLLALSVKPGETKEWVIKFEQREPFAAIAL